MRQKSVEQTLRECLEHLGSHELSPFDFLPEGTLAEKVINLVLTGPPNGVSARLAGLFRETLSRIKQVDTGHARVVILGGGTGLSNILGGDSRKENWADNPFTGLKELFPQITSIVCVTDDGGSTGELLKDLPLIGLGDLRHVLLSSVRRRNLGVRYRLDPSGISRLALGLHAVFNYRFDGQPVSSDALLADVRILEHDLPPELKDYLIGLIRRLFSDQRLQKSLQRPHCLGNLLLAAAIFAHVDPSLTCTELAAEQEMLHRATLHGISDLAEQIGADAKAVLPCTTAPAQLRVLYANGVLVTGEEKSGLADRGYPVDRTMVSFMREPLVPEEVVRALSDAEIIIFAPGSLYTSIIPILQVPGITEIIRNNDAALKILVSNIWVQKGETDATRDVPERKFHVSDLVRAYSRNIPGGVSGLFTYIMALGMGEIPGSILQNYALEDKEPIYLDRRQLRQIGFEPVEAGIFSEDLLRRLNIIQHDPDALAQAVRTLWCLPERPASLDPVAGTGMSSAPAIVFSPRETFVSPCQRFAAIRAWLDTVSLVYTENGSGRKSELGTQKSELLRERMTRVLWSHPDILLDHLAFTESIALVGLDQWSRCQQWDNIFSFYDPRQRMILVREDQAKNASRFEMAFLVALGQSLLGNYAAGKTMLDVPLEGEIVGRVFRLSLRPDQERKSFFNAPELDTYLHLARMRRSTSAPHLYSRLVNNDEGFTPPGLLFGLFYTWYLDNRFASNIEYKMSILRHPVSDLIPEQVKIADRREGLIDFFRETVFRHRLQTRENG